MLPKRLFILVLMVALGPPALAQDIYPSPRHEVFEERRSLPQPSNGKGSMVLDDLYWEWEGVPRWATGVDWGGRTFFGSLDHGRNFFGSSLDESIQVPVEIRFSRSEPSAARVFRRDQGYADAGVGSFPGAAYDVSDPGNPRRLNLCFVEDLAEGPSNLEWDPERGYFGKREYLFIMNSDYDEKAMTYAGANIRAGNEHDILYSWWPYLVEGRSLLESDPSTLLLKTTPIRNFQGLPQNQQVDLSWSYTPGPEVVALHLYQSLNEISRTRVRTLDPDDAQVELHGLENGVIYTYQMEAVDENGTVIHESPQIQVVPQVVSLNIQRAGFWNHRSDYADVWGYTDAQTGIEYALLCVRGEGLSIIDISGPIPVEVGFAPSTLARVDAKDVKVYDHYAVLINENASPQIIDLADPTQPVTVATIELPGNSGAHNAYIEGHYLYIVGAHRGGGILTYDLTDPTQPVLVGEHSPTYYHDVYVRDGIAYASAIFRDEGVDVVDLRNPASPFPLGNFTYSGAGAHNVTLSEDGRYAFVGDEVGSSGNHTRVFDIQDLEQVRKVADIIVNPEGVTHNSYIKENLLYIAHYTDGLRIFDVADPTRPVEVGYYDTYIGGPEERFSGAWSVYPYLASGKILVSDMQSGLFVLRFGETPTGTQHFPDETALNLEVYPQPFTTATTLRYRLAEPSWVQLGVYDVLGRPLETLIDAVQQPGLQHAPLEANGWAAGTYIVRLEARALPSGETRTVFRTLMHVR